MKGLVLLCFMSILLTNCAFPGYTFENKGQTVGVDFRTGNWLLNHVDAPTGIEEKINQQVYDDFHSILKSRLSRIQDKKSLLIKREIPFNPSKIELENLKKGTGFDYFINLKAANLKKDFELFSIGNRKNTPQEKNSNEIVLEIYDLNQLDIIYSQKVIASADLDENNKGDVHFAIPSNNMIMKGYKKLFKKLKKKSLQ
jgi:hypothetical protein